MPRTKKIAQKFLVVFDENKENFGIINVPKNQRLVIKTPLTSLSKFPEPSGKFEILTKAQKCALLLEENQSLIEIYQRNQKLSTFDSFWPAFDRVRNG